MNRQEVAALLAYAVKLAPHTAPADQAAAEERLDQWADLLADVPPTAPHPTGRHWDASQVVRHHVATSPYPIKPSDVSRFWHAFRRDVVDRHHDPVPAADPDDPQAYRAELLGTRHAVAIGAAPAATFRELTGGTTREERDQFAADRLAALGSYVPARVEDVLDRHRPRKAARRAAIKAGRPDALAVACTWCKAEPGAPCTQRAIGPKAEHGARTERAIPHPTRVDRAALGQGLDRQEFAA
ncbi:cell surface glycoprotein [Streptomyces sp. BPTC-684]|uniref:zinc finger domain-containing protein n=1 Tax=Streptomyces sp. BPTC-684 TaxID=3043734 RepID=UPI0024B1D33F|nr:cell surface glycoprotein [Streptomyces sp. BPTC-684]WHM36293.1 cell surface glycoprotein [Streptomyces sp. BPTC-684]